MIRNVALVLALIGVSAAASGAPNTNHCDSKSSRFDSCTPFEKPNLPIHKTDSGKNNPGKNTSNDDSDKNGTNKPGTNKPNPPVTPPVKPPVKTTTIKPTLKAPEIDPASALAGLSLLAGGIAVVRGRRK